MISVSEIKEEMRAMIKDAIEKVRVEIESDLFPCPKDSRWWDIGKEENLCPKCNHRLKLFSPTLTETNKWCLNCGWDNIQKWEMSR